MERNWSSTRRLGMDKIGFITTPENLRGERQFVVWRLLISNSAHTHTHTHTHTHIYIYIFFLKTHFPVFGKLWAGTSCSFRWNVLVIVQKHFRQFACGKVLLLSVAFLIKWISHLPQKPLNCSSGKICRKLRPSVEFCHPKWLFFSICSQKGLQIAFGAPHSNLVTFELSLPHDLLLVRIIIVIIFADSC